MAVMQTPLVAAHRLTYPRIHASTYFIVAALSLHYCESISITGASSTTAAASTSAAAAAAPFQQQQQQQQQQHAGAHQTAPTNATNNESSSTNGHHAKIIQQLRPPPLSDLLYPVANNDEMMVVVPPAADDNAIFLGGYGAGEAVVAVQNAAHGGRFEFIPAEGQPPDYKTATRLTLDGVNQPMIVSNGKWNSSEGVRFVENRAIEQVLAGRDGLFATLIFSWKETPSSSSQKSVTVAVDTSTNGSPIAAVDGIEYLNTGMVSMEILSIIPRESDEAGDGGIAMTYLVRLLNSTSVGTTPEGELIDSIDFDKWGAEFVSGTLMVDLVVDDNADAADTTADNGAHTYHQSKSPKLSMSLRHQTEIGTMKELYIRNSLASQGKLVEAQGWLLWWLPISWVEIAFCCPLCMATFGVAVPACLLCLL